MPGKTFRTIVAVAILGAICLIWFGEGDIISFLRKRDETVPAGPMPSQTPHTKVDANPVVEDHLSKLGVPRKPHRPIEEPPGTSMCRFYSALREVERQPSASVARVLHYGDSILTSGELSGIARRILQGRFGDAGHGFVLLGKPWRWYHHRDVRHGARGDWSSRPLTSAPYRDGMFGLGGVAFETRSFNAKAWVATVSSGPVGTKVASFDVSYLRQPGGGEFDLVLNGRVVETVSTAGETKETVHRHVVVPPGNAKLEVRTRGNGQVRVFGAVLESGEKGVVYDSLAINGASATNLSRFNEEHWVSELKHREANLVVLMFGANEGHNKHLELGDYKERLGTVLRTIREGAPETACLVMGPLDQAKRGVNGRLGSRRMPLRLSKAQREVSFEQGCAFFDTIEAMGGENSMARWRRSGLGGGDLIHPTEDGARQIGTWLADSLIAGYEDFLYNGEICASSVTSL